MREANRTRWGKSAMRIALCLMCLGLASSSMASEGGAIDAARGVVEMARESSGSSSSVRWSGWEVRQEDRHIRASQGPWEIVASGVARRGDRLELVGDVVASGPAYSVIAERVVVDDAQLEVLDAQVVWPGGAVVRIARMVHAMETGEAVIERVSAGDEATSRREATGVQTESKVKESKGR